MLVPRNKRTGAWSGYYSPHYDDLVEAPAFVYDRLRYVTYSRGRSSVKVLVKGETGKYELTLADFMGLIPKGWPVKGVVGKWKFVKRGTAYALAPVERFTPKHPDYARREIVAS